MKNATQIAVGVLAVMLLASPSNAQIPGESAPLYAGVHIEEQWIPMYDGVRLAVNLFAPEGVKPGEQFPALLEYLPYRKDDWSAQRDVGLHSYFVRRGYVVARVDIRGTGRSEGQTPDREYSEQEQQDGMEVIAWLARQSWSNGNVGMLGISWGGFNSIQMAMRRPPALKAIIAVCATDELFHDDIHYIDGMMHVDEFELSMDLQSAITRAPDFPLDEDTLRKRFDNPPWFLLYLHQQRDGAFWRRTSLDSSYSSIQIPVFLIGGFLDGYRDSIPRMLTHIKAPVKALIGPWNHTFPHDAEPGPEIEWRAEAVRWWDHWLKARKNGIMQEPRVEVYMRHWYPPDPKLKEVPGEWRAEQSWPPAGQQSKTFYMTSAHGLSANPISAARHELKYVPSIGVEAGFWWGDLTSDQRPSDAFSLVYDSPPLKTATAILGLPEALLEASASAPLADWFVRLSDVAPDGTATLITGGGLSGAQRDSAEPSDLEPDRMYSLRIPLHFTSWVFPARHKMRVAISNSLWPMIWPTPYAVTTSLQLGGLDGSKIILPVVPLDAPSRPAFPKPAEAPKLAGIISSGETWPGTWKIERDAIRQATTIYWSGDGSTQFPWGKENNHEKITYHVADADSAVSSVDGEASTEVDLSNLTLRWQVFLSVSSDQKNFYYKFTRQLWNDGQLIREKSWHDTIQRDHQ